ncbi:tetratricopeptide repeat protein [Ectothiorhodospiraceae bacterium WFHF3C12]|nr:tetratricopeptide repeat protein [Ectothiorhodospiraceae bacterium WFHF3C12]
MTGHDHRGLSTSASHRASIDAYENALEALLSGRGSALMLVDEALASDPGFAMGHALRIAVLILAADERLDPALRDSVNAMGTSTTPNRRERAYAVAGRAWLDRDATRAFRIFGDLAVDYPRDLLALRLAHTGDFRLGQRAMLRDRLARALPDWSADTPGYSYVLGMHAFGLAESALYAPAERFARAALALNPGNAGAMHALTHVMEMQGRPEEGVALLRHSVGNWADSRAHAVHQWWHLALFHTELTQLEDALCIHDRHMTMGGGDDTAALVDAAALLWRLCLRGVDVGRRFHTLADLWAERPVGGLNLFQDAHAMLAFVGAERPARIEAMLTTLRARADGGGAGAAVIAGRLIPVCEALAAFGRGDYASAVHQLSALRDLPYGGGGSQAQYDLLHLTLVEAALRSRQRRLARALIAERLALRPASPLNHELARALGDRPDRTSMIPVYWPSIEPAATYAR